VNKKRVGLFILSMGLLLFLMWGSISIENKLFIYIAFPLVGLILGLIPLLLSGKSDISGIENAVNENFIPKSTPVNKTDFQQTSSIDDISCCTHCGSTEDPIEVDKKRFSDMGLLVGGVAHDLNNILSGIVTYTDVLLNDKRHAIFHKDLEIIQTSGERAAAVVEDLLTITRGVSIKKYPKDINEVIRVYLKSPELMVYKNHYPKIDVIHSLEENIGNVLCSEIHILKMVMNLVNNGMESIDVDGQILISSSKVNVLKTINGFMDVPPGEYIKLSVQDSGSGIDDSQICKIFEPFHTTKQAGRSGTGLGLSIVWNSVMDHGGHINIISSKAGTIFNIYLPISQEVDFASGSSALSELSGNGEVVLVVDDEEIARIIASNILTQLNYTPLLAASGEEAINLFKSSESIKLVLLDMVMGLGMDGYKTFKEMKQIDKNAKAIVISGIIPDERIEQMNSLGVNVFVRKPYKTSELGVAIKDNLPSK
jgi:two-component system, cell cycle sensor histidine kinase and response regulator CckA